MPCPDDHDHVRGHGVPLPLSHPVIPSRRRGICFFTFDFRLATFDLSTYGDDDAEAAGC